MKAGETAYDHVERQLLDQLMARIGVGGVHDLLMGLAQVEWERANQVVSAELERLGIHSNSIAMDGG